jgi:hypothetical protein
LFSQCVQHPNSIFLFLFVALFLCSLFFVFLFFCFLVSLFPCAFGFPFLLN